MIEGYVICSTPRSGSNLLCDALRSTGIAGTPDEYFNSRYRDFFLERWSQPPTVSQAQFLELALAAGTSSNGIFAVKIQWPHLAERGVHTMYEPARQNMIEFLNRFRRIRCVFLT